MFIKKCTKCLKWKSSWNAHMYAANKSSGVVIVKDISYKFYTWKYDFLLSKRKILGIWFLIAQVTLSPSLKFSVYKREHKSDKFLISPDECTWLDLTLTAKNISTKFVSVLLVPSDRTRLKLLKSNFFGRWNLDMKNNFFYP